MDRKRKIVDWFGESLEAVGAALSSIPRSLAHDSERIAVTGLARAGKTVFVTALTQALLQTKNSPANLLPFFPWKGQVDAVNLETIRGIPRFPFEERLAELLSEAPTWPTRTTGLSGIRIRIDYTPSSTIGRQLLRRRTLDLDLIDYPGEWLLDLPLLSLSYNDWSLQMEELASAGKRAEFSKEWVEQASRIDSDAPENSFDLAQVGSAYVDYLKRCRAEHLTYVQPGRFGIGGIVGVGLDAIFFPMSRVQSPKKGTNGAALEGRYRTYQRQVRRFYLQVFGRLRRQVVLVDLLTALQQGHDALADLALAVRAIMEAFEDLQNPLLSKLLTRRVDRLALAATKADHITASQMANLVSLLRDMIGEPFVQANARQAGLMAIASVRSTNQVTRHLHGEVRQLLQGIPLDDSEVVEVLPGEIPGQIPDRDHWDQFEFRIRQFAPLRVTPPMAGPLPHINLDKVLQFLVA